jgi:hypothetical protein
MGAWPLVVTYPLTGRSRAIVEEELGGTAQAIYLVDLAPAARAHALERAAAVLSHDTPKEPAARSDPANPQRSAIAVHRRWRRLGTDPRSAIGIAGCSQ